MNLNKVIVVGRLTRDPENRTLPSGKPVVSLGIATNRVWVDQNGNKQEDAEFHDITAFGKLADICSRYLTKGQLLLIEGRLRTRSWQDRDGNTKYRTEIIADNMQMGPRPAGSSSPAPDTPTKTPDQTVSQEQIPVIEAEEPIEGSPVKDQDTALENTSEKKETENKNPEVNVKNIPF